jgi:L-rhamnose mutarotase
LERYCFTFRLKPGTEEEYKRRHDEIWPELTEAISRAGVRNYSLFRRGLDVIGYAECHPDAATAFALVGETDVNARWQKWFEEVIAERYDESGHDVVYEEVWHLD